MNSCLTENYAINFQNMNAKRRQRISRNQSRNSQMSTRTKNFIQKICYKKTASIDMTQYGFINDSKLHPVNLLLRPLKAQLEKICGKPSRNASVRRNSPVVVKRVKLNSEQSPSSSRSPHSTRQVSPSSRGSPQRPTSAVSSPGSRTPRSPRSPRSPPSPSSPCRQRKAPVPLVPKPVSPPNAGKKRRVTVVSPTNKVKKNEVIVTKR